MANHLLTFKQKANPYEGKNQDSILADLYAIMVYRAAMIANTVPYYLRQDGKLTGERLDYYRVEIGNALQAITFLREEFLEQPGRIGLLRKPLDIGRLRGMEEGIGALYNIALSLRQGIIPNYSSRL